MKLKLLATALLLVAASGASAAPFTGDLTSNVIMGDGIDNGDFTGDRDNGIEVALRGRLRYDTLGAASPVVRFDGDHTYTYFLNESNPQNGNAIFNVDWSANADTSNSSNPNPVNGLDWRFSTDYDPTVGVSGPAGDPINVAFADHDFGSNTTPQSGGTVAANATEYGNLIANNNVAQNSFNLGHLILGDFPNTPGIYTFTLSAYDKGQVEGTALASTSIDVIISAVPLPATLPFLVMGLGLLGFKSRRKAKTPV